MKKADRTTSYELATALIVARLIDQPGNDYYTARSTYGLATTDGRRSRIGLTDGQNLLLRVGLLLNEGGRIGRTPALDALCMLPDPVAIEALAQIVRAAEGAELDQNDLGYFPSDGLLMSRRELLGVAGEELVTAACRAELNDLGRPDLSQQVQRVSLISDALGYDIAAPRIDGTLRRLEVKAQSKLTGHMARFFITRHEFDVGLRSQDWSLVVCQCGEPSRIIGWCAASALTPYLPIDQNGRWTEAAVQIPTTALSPGLPDAI